MSTDLLNLLLGIIGSLIAWLLLTKALRPRLTLGGSLQELIREDGTVAYRVEYRNPRIRRVEDVRVTVRLFLRTKPGVTHPQWVATYIPVDEPFKPVLGKGSVYRRFLVYIRRRRRPIQYPVLRLDQVDCGNLRGHLSSDAPQITDFRTFLQKTGATVELSIRSSDGFSGTYRTVERTYQHKDVVTKDRRKIHHE